MQFGAAMETLDRLREEIDAHLFADALKQLQQRTWLLHWANFAFWSVADGPAKLLDLLLQDRFTVALQINAPHLLRCAPAADELPACAARECSFPTFYDVSVWGVSATRHGPAMSRAQRQTRGRVRLGECAASGSCEHRGERPRGRRRALQRKHQAITAANRSSSCCAVTSSRRTS
jgi:hypothetical protein